MSKNGRVTGKYLIRLYKSDVEALKGFYPKAGYNAAVRTLVARSVRRLEALAAEELARLDTEAEIETSKLKEEQGDAG